MTAENDREPTLDELKSQLSHTKGEVTKYRGVAKNVLEATNLLIGGLELKIPVSPYVTVTVTIPTDSLSSAEWDAFDAVLAAMRPALTKTQDRAAAVAKLDELRAGKSR